MMNMDVDVGSIVKLCVASSDGTCEANLKLELLTVLYYQTTGS